MSKNALYDKLRFNYDLVSLYDENPSVFYNGAPEPYEDPADYLPRNFSLKGVRIA